MKAPSLLRRLAFVLLTVLGIGSAPAHTSASYDVINRATVPGPSGTGTQPIAVLCRQTEQDTSGISGTPATPRTRAWTYDATGHVLPADGPRTDVADITTFTYHPANDPDLGKRGHLATVTNAAGHVTRIDSYDANGYPLLITDPNGLATTLSYDLRGRLTGKTSGTPAVWVLKSRR